MGQAFRSHTCGELRPDHIGQRVTLSGWVHRRRDHGHLTFFDLRDRYGITQVVTSAEDAPEAHQAAEAARYEWVVQVQGTVRERPAGTANAELATGAIEVAVDQFTVLNQSRVPPFYINEEQPGLDESLRFQYRYLDLRRPPLQQRILLRARLSGAIRRALEDDAFVDIETPTLIRSTPGRGARLRGAQPPAAGQLLRSAAVARRSEAAADGCRLRPLLPDRTLLSRRGLSRGSRSGVHPAGPGDELRGRGGCHGHGGAHGHRRQPRRAAGPAAAQRPVPAADLRGGDRTLRLRQAGHPLRHGAGRPDGYGRAAWISGSSPSRSRPAAACGASARRAAATTPASSWTS